MAESVRRGKRDAVDDVRVQMLWQTTGDATKAETRAGRDAGVLAVAVSPSAVCCRGRGV